MEDKTKRKIFVIIYNFLKIVSILFLIILSIVLILQKSSINMIDFGNYRLYVVNNKNNKYVLGDVVLLRDSSIYYEDDFVVYRTLNSEYKPVILLNDVESVKKEDKVNFYEVSGINIKEEQIYGSVVSKMNILSIIYKFISIDIGFYLAVIGPILLLIFLEIIFTIVEVRFRKKHSEKKKKEFINEIQKLKDEIKVVEDEISLNETRRLDIVKEIEYLTREKNIK